MAVFMATAALVSGGAQGFAAHRAGKASKAQGKANAALSMIQAEEAVEWAEYNETRLRVRQKFGRDQMIVDMLNNGFSIDEGTTNDIILGNQEFNDELDALAIRNRGLADAVALRNQAVSQRFGGKQAQQVANIQATGSIISGSTKAVGLLA